MTESHDHVSEDRLIDLLNGLAPEQDARESLVHVRGCALCENHLRMLVRERESLRARPAPRYVGGEIMLPRYDVVPGRLGVLRSRRARWIGAASIAAAAVVVFLATYLFQPSTSDAVDYWMPTPLRDVSMDMPGPPTPLSMAMDAYEEHDPARALALLENVGQDRNETDAMLRRLYQASALVNDDRPEEARQILDDLDVTRLPEPWRGRAGWVQYITLRKTAEDSRADQVLEELTQEPGEIGEMARKERQRLRGD
jgi:hypothetical protein